MRPRQPGLKGCVRVFAIQTDDIKRLERDMKNMRGDILKDVIPRSVNRVLASTKTAVSRHIANETGLKVGTVKKRIIAYKARRGELSAYLDASSGRGYNLITSVPKGSRKPGVFNRRLKSGKRKGRAKAAGVVSRAWGKSKVYPGTFITNTSRGPLVVSRKSNARKGKAFKFIKGPSIRAEFKRTKTKGKTARQVMTAKVNEALPKQIAHDYQHLKKTKYKRR